MCNSALGLQMHLRLNYLSIYLSICKWRQTAAPFPRGQM